MLTFIKKIVIHQKKDYLLLLSILTLIASFEFCFIAMYDHLSRLDLKIDWMTFRAIAFIPFLTLMIAVVLSVFVAKYFIQNKKHEFSMLLLFGRKPKDLFLYLIIQRNLTIAGTACCIHRKPQLFCCPHMGAR